MFISVRSLILFHFEQRSASFTNIPSLTFAVEKKMFYKGISFIFWIFARCSTWCLIGNRRFDHSEINGSSLSIMTTSYWERRRLKSLASRLFAQLFVQAQIKVNIKAPRHWLLPEKSTCDQWFPSQRASNAENVSIWWRFHEQPQCRPLPGVMTLSWATPIQTVARRDIGSRITSVCGEFNIWKIALRYTY